MANLDIRRAEFLRLTALLALASCDATRSEPQVVHAPMLPPVATDTAGIPPRIPTPSPEGTGAATTNDDPEIPIDPSCNNAQGSLDVCKRIGPACEGLVDECMGLDDLRPRVAQAFGECFAKARRPGCRDKAMGACMRAAVMSACIEPGSVAQCKRIMKSCHDAGKTPTYSLEECAKVVSAPTPSNRATDWPRVDAERLGPTSSDSPCSLRNVLPFQPWGPSWDGTFDRIIKHPRP